MRRWLPSDFADIFRFVGPPRSKKFSMYPSDHNDFRRFSLTDCDFKGPSKMVGVDRAYLSVLGASVYTDPRVSKDQISIHRQYDGPVIGHVVRRYGVMDYHHGDPESCSLCAVMNIMDS